MNAEIIAIGDELASGQRLDTNSQWLAQELGFLGLSTIRHTTIADDLTGNVEAFRSAAERADIVICTGGLGPTLDDLTRQAMAEAFELDLQLDEPSLQHIQTLFASRKREMPERNRIQAMFPAGSQVIPNPHGSAPGIDLKVGSPEQGRECRFFALPGVPAEMKEMWHQTVVPRIELALNSQLGALHFHEVKVFGIGESDVEVKLPELMRRDRDPTVGITVSRATITLRLAGRAHSAEEFGRRIAPSLTEIDEALGDLVFGSGDQTLQEVVAELLTRQGKSMTCIELGCASWVGDWMLGISAANSACFMSSHAFPTAEVAQAWLGEKTDGPVDLPNLARGLFSRIAPQNQCDVLLLVSSYPSHVEMENASQPFEQTFCVITEDDTHVKQTRMGGHPDVLGPRIGKTGLDFARRILAGLPIK